jgi:hypothetical protein
MSETVIPPAVETTEAPKDADPKALANEALKKAGIKLKARDREYVPKDIDDLVGKANRVFGLEQELEGVKKEKDAIATQRASWQRLEAEDDAALDEFDKLPVNVQRNALKALQRRAQQAEAAAKEPPELVEAKRAIAERDAKLREYEQGKKTEAEKAKQAEAQAELRAAHESVMKMAQGVGAALKVDTAKHPAALRGLQPVVARHMRAALMVEAETGVAVDHTEIIANVQRDISESFAATSSGMPDDALYDALGEGLVKRVLGEHLRRVKGIKPTPQPQNGSTNGTKQDGPKRGTPAFLR